MSFAVAPESYDRFMGRYSGPLAPLFADFASITNGQKVLDVGCGPGALTAELVRRVGASAVAAVDPSAPFTVAVQERNPGVDVRRSSAEDLPFEDGTFDAALAQLVVHFMSDPVAGLSEMARVTKTGGVVAACVWDHAGGTGPLALFWEAARQLDPRIDNESTLAGTRQGHLAELLDDAGLDDIQQTSLTVRVEYDTFDDWWQPMTLGVGPAGAHVSGLDPEGREALRQRCRDLFGNRPIGVTARAWAARGRR